jgi:hypothetical protein
MFSKQYKTIIAVHDDEVYWFSSLPDTGGHRFFQMPLQQLLDDETLLPSFPEWLKGSHKTLCIIPDHWFGSQRFSFKSGKPSLIEPFLERKLRAAFPDQKTIRHFFNYRQTDHHSGASLSALHFQEDRSYRLYDVLRKLNHSPQLITAPAFLWEDALQRAIEGFGSFGSLVVHLTGKEFQLYFFHQGKYQFSRSVLASNGDEGGDDGLEALGYEINQSLYMFSQTAKSELDRIYMHCDSDQCREKLAEVLDREVIDLKPLMDTGPSEGIDLPHLAVLSGWLRRSHLHSGTGIFGIMHRQVKQAIEWRPVQWAGAIIGLVLLLGLVGEHFMLRAMFAEADNNYHAMQRRAIVASPGVALSEYPDTLERVVGRAKRSILVDAVHRLPEGFPSHVRLRKLELSAGPGSAPSLKVATRVHAHDAEELQVLLQGLIVELKGRFQNAKSLSLNDFDIRLSRPGNGHNPNRYQVDFTLELT